jgi:DUF4097 and DUF4098 domain-containing protein YvlB
LSLENINGDVTVEGWKKNEVSIRAVKKGESKDLDRIKIIVEVDEYDDKDWIHVKTDYPTSTGSVDYTIQAPSSAILEDIELVSGNLTVTGITGYLSLGTVNGSVTATGAAESAWIETVNGEISLSFEKMDKGQSVDLESVNGAILLRIPAKANAQVDAETINGTLSNEFDLPVEKGKWVGSSMKGRCGSGGARISLETVNGNIDVKKR